MKKYEVIDLESGNVFDYYDTYAQAYGGLMYANMRDKNAAYTIIEHPEGEVPEFDYEYIDYQINEMIDCMERICNLANLNHISLTYSIDEKGDRGSFMSAWRGKKYGITFIGNRINIFKRIYNQIKGGKNNEKI